MKNKEERNKLEKSGVYKLICDNCNGIYVDQTGWTFHTRIKEHKTSYENNKLDSTFALHLRTEYHQSSFIPGIIHFQEKGITLNLLAHEIMKTTDIILNEVTEMSNS